MNPYYIKPPIKISNLGWLSDLHLDYASQTVRNQFYKELQSSDCDSAVITGDTAAFPSLEEHLTLLAQSLSPRPVYYLIGNHECYYSSIPAARSLVRDLCSRISNLYDLQEMGAVWLNQHTVMVGHHGWADARTGWGADTVIRSADHWCIDDFRDLSHEARFELMGKLGNESARCIRKHLQPVLGRARKIIIATHFPCYQTSAKYDDQVCGPTHSPHYVNASLGGMLISLARNTPQIKYMVMSGHTHHEARELILRNLESHVAGAVPGRPTIHSILCL